MANNIVPPNLELAAKSLQEFYGDSSLTRKISELQSSIANSTGNNIAALLVDQSIGQSVLDAALLLKEVGSQINVVIHAVGIVLALPYLLDSDEIVIYASLGAGNTGKPFDLETDKRVAEFKFINWQGGAESIRQNQLFKDFFYLAEHAGAKRRCLYVFDTQYPLKFFNGRRRLSSVLSHNRALRDDFYNRHSDRYRVVSEYFLDNKERVELIGLRGLIPCFSIDAGLSVSDGGQRS